jgi:transcription elongation factor GreA
VLLTTEGFEQLRRELQTLRTDKIPRLRELLRDARDDGALDDNPTLVDLLDEQAQLERRIATLEAQLAVAEVATPPRDGRAGIGSVVRIRDILSGDAFEYELVGPLEADATNGRVSTASPIGRALIGRQRGAQVEVATPRGSVTLEVLEVAESPHARGGVNLRAERWSRRAPQVGSGAADRALRGWRRWA